MGIGSRACGRAAVAIGASLLMFACGGGPSPSPTPTPTPTPPPSGGTPPTPPPTTPPPGTVTVTGSERLAWSQGGDPSTLRFVAFVDGNLVRLDAAACAPGGGESECTSPLPPLSNGLHTIAVAAVSLASGQTGPRSEALTVQKVSAQMAGVATGGATIALDTGGTVKAPDVRATVPVFQVEVVAEGLRGPLQLAPAPDGRVFVAEADGLVRVITPGATAATVAYDARAALYPPPVGPLGLAMHPAFADNGFVYLSFLAEERPGEIRLRILRLREVAGTLGEAATVYEGPVTVDARATGDADGAAAQMAVLEGPRLAFAPTGRLHALLPLGLQFDDPTVASWPHASVVRLADDGRRPDEGPLSGITTHPLALTWRPGTGALWGVFADTASIAAARPIDRGASTQAADDAGPVLHIVDGDPAAARGLALHGATPDTVAWAQAFMAGAGVGAVTPIRLSAPILLDPFLSGAPGELADVVSTGDGALLLGMNSADRTRGYILRVRR